MQALFETMDENLLQLREGEFSSALVCMRASPDERRDFVGVRESGGQARYWLGGRG